MGTGREARSTVAALAVVLLRQFLPPPNPSRHQQSRFHHSPVSAKNLVHTRRCYGSRWISLRKRTRRRGNGRRGGCWPCGRGMRAPAGATRRLLASGAESGGKRAHSRVFARIVCSCVFDLVRSFCEAEARNPRVIERNRPYFHQSCLHNFSPLSDRANAAARVPFGR